MLICAGQAVSGGLLEDSVPGGTDILGGLSVAGVRDTFVGVLERSRLGR